MVKMDVVRGMVLVEIAPVPLRDSFVRNPPVKGRAESEADFAKRQADFNEAKAAAEARDEKERRLATIREALQVLNETNEAEAMTDADIARREEQAVKDLERMRSLATKRAQDLV